MWRQLRMIVMVCSLLWVGELRGWEPPQWPFSGAAGSAGSTAVWHEDERIVGWATEVVKVVYGANVAEEWRTPERALGPATAGFGDVLVLGDGGEVTLGFGGRIENGAGWDFVVYENAFSDGFLELAWVEVSSDGRHFVRMPNYSLTPGPVAAFGQDMDPTLIHGLASKYRAGYGTPFDLEELVAAYENRDNEAWGFSATYREHLAELFPLLDVTAVRYVRLVDIIGDGSALDAQGEVIFDPHPTQISAGFDLNGVGVRHFAADAGVSFAQWAATNGLSGEHGADADGDGWVDYLEYLLGTDPRDAQDRPQVVIAVTATGYRVTVPMNPEARGMALLEVSEDLREWRRVATVAAADRRSRTYEHDGAGPLFVRLVGW